MDVKIALSRERQIKNRGRANKTKLTENRNPDWKFMNVVAEGIKKMCL